MSIWLIFPPNRETALRAIYAAEDIRGRDNPDEGEAIGTIQVNAPGTLAFVGSSRIDMPTALSMVAANAWLTATDTFPSDWEYPSP